MSPNAEGGVAWCLSQLVQLYTGDQINFGDLTPYLTYATDNLRQFQKEQTLLLVDG
jgi:hypothetical protein